MQTEVKAWKDGKSATWSAFVWRTGIPQQEGWVSESDLNAQAPPEAQKPFTNKPDEKGAKKVKKNED
jgi:hypothetical protein